MIRPDVSCSDVSGVSRAGVGSEGRGGPFLFRGRGGCVLKGAKPPVEFGERTRDCSPGHAGKEGHHLAMKGQSYGFSCGHVWM